MGSQGQIRHLLVLQMDKLKPADRSVVAKALSLAEEIHAGVFRKPARVDGYVKVPYIVHPMRVALILCEELGHLDKDMLSAALLHDVVEDSDGKVTTTDLEEQFGRSIALMVSVLTKPPADKKIPREQQLHTYHDRIASAAMPTRLIKLSDRLDNIRDAVKCADAVFQKRYLVETREIYVPMALNTNPYLHEQILECCEELEKQLSERPD